MDVGVDGGILVGVEIGSGGGDDNSLVAKDREEGSGAGDGGFEFGAETGRGGKEDDG